MPLSASLRLKDNELSCAPSNGLHEVRIPSQKEGRFCTPANGFNGPHQVFLFEQAGTLPKSRC